MDIFNRLEKKCNYWQSLYLFNYVVETHMLKARMRYRQADVAYMTKEWKRAIRKKENTPNSLPKTARMEIRS